MAITGGGLPHKGKYLDLRPKGELARNYKKNRRARQGRKHNAFQLVAGKTMLPFEVQLELERNHQEERKARYEPPRLTLWSEDPPPWRQSFWGFLRHPFDRSIQWLRRFKGRINWKVPLFGPWDLRVKLSYFGAAVLLALLVPSLGFVSHGLQVKNNLYALGSQAFTDLSSAGESLQSRNTQSAQTGFRSAYQAFFKAGSQVDSLGNLAVTLAENAPLVSDKVGTAQSLIQLGKSVSLLGESMAGALERFQNLQLAENVQPEESQPLTPAVQDIQKQLKEASQALEKSKAHIRDLDVSALPSEVQSEVNSFQEKLPFFESAAKQGSAFLDFLLGVLGHNNPQKYLVLFQNNSEIRPGGGFIGSYAEINVFQGKVRDLNVQGVYRLDGQLHEKIIPPRPLQRITPNWGMRDSNWFLDFRKNAQLASDFYEKAGGGTVDGVLAITPTVIEDVLEVTGPVEFPQYDMRITAHNFRSQIQEHTEFEYDREVNRPKKILADFTPLLLDRLSGLPQEKLSRVFEGLIQNLERKHAMFWFRDKPLQRYITQQGWGGRVLSSEKDYLSVVHSNVAGYKTDKVMEDKLDYEVELTEEGKVHATLKITRTHHGNSSDKIFYNSQNRDYIKVYTPKGSELIDARGATIRDYWARVDYEKEPGWKALDALSTFRDSFRVDQKTGTHIFTESGKTVFGNWLFTNPGKTSTLTLKYELPFRLSGSSATYSLLVQKQPGAKPATLQVGLNGKNLSPQWGYPDGMSTGPDGFSYIGSLRSDKFFGFSFHK